MRFESIEGSLHFIKKWCWENQHQHQMMISLHNRLYYNRCVSRIFIVPQLSAQTVKSKFPIAFLISLLIRLQDNVTGRYQYNNATVNNFRKVQQVFGITFVFYTLYIQHRLENWNYLMVYFDTRLWNVLFNSRQWTEFLGRVEATIWTLHLI